MVLITAGITFFVLGIILLLSAFIFWAIPATGICFLVFGILFIIAGAVILVIYNIKRKKEEALRIQKEEEFGLWLKQQGFVISTNTNYLLVDAVNKKWCKKFDKNIFDFSEAVGASINKHRSSQTNTTGSSSGSGSRSSSSRKGIYTSGRYGSGSSNNNRNSSSTRISEDTSTYEVLIKTTSIDTPLVIIDCYRDKASAEKICAIIDIMRGKKKRNRTKENDDGEQTEIAD